MKAANALSESEITLLTQDIDEKIIAPALKGLDNTASVASGFSTESGILDALNQPGGAHTVRVQLQARIAQRISQQQHENVEEEEHNG